MQIHRMWFYWGEATGYEAKVLFYQEARGVRASAADFFRDPPGEPKSEENVP